MNDDRDDADGEARNADSDQANDEPKSSDEHARDESAQSASRRAAQDSSDRKSDSRLTPDSNPPRTTTGGWFTAPKFGSAGSGGAEFEPGPEKD